MPLINPSNLINKIKPFLLLPNFGINLTSLGGINIGDNNSFQNLSSIPSFPTIAGGELNITSNYGTINGGDSNYGVGLYSTILGGYNNNAEGSYSTCLGGRRADANKFGQVAMGSYEPGRGSQFSILQWYSSFTSLINQTYEIFLDNSSQRAFLDNNRIWQIQFFFVCSRGNTNFRSGERRLMIRRSTANPVLLGAANTIGADQIEGISPFTNLIFEADTINNSLKISISVTSSSENIKFKACALITEMPTL